MLYVFDKYFPRLCVLVAAALLTLAVAVSQANATKYCDPAVSKPCGNGCTALENTCRTPWTTAKAGKRPSKAKKGYDNPTYVDKVPADGQVK